jgi:CopG family nickel-responsive transcriptional regulator
VAVQRITITVDDDLADALDALVGDHGWANRSEAMSDPCRQGSPAAAPKPTTPHPASTC